MAEYRHLTPGELNWARPLNDSMDWIVDRLEGRNLLVGCEFATNPCQRGRTVTVTNLPAYQSQFGPDRWCFMPFDNGTTARMSCTEGKLVLEAVSLGGGEGFGRFSYGGMESAELRALWGKAVTLSFDYTMTAPFRVIVFHSLAHEISCHDPGEKFLVDIRLEVTSARKHVSATFIVPSNVKGLSIVIQPFGEGIGSLGSFVLHGYMKLEVGDHDTRFEPRPAVEELMLCRRYYQPFPPNCQIRCSKYGSQRLMASHFLSPPMRVTPTLLNPEGIRIMSATYVTGGIGKDVQLTLHGNSRPDEVIFYVTGTELNDGVFQAGENVAFDAEIYA